MSTSSTLAAALLGCVLALSACGAGCYYYIYLVYSESESRNYFSPLPFLCRAVCVSPLGRHILYSFILYEYVRESSQVFALFYPRSRARLGRAAMPESD